MDRPAWLREKRPIAEVHYDTLHAASYDQNWWHITASHRSFLQRFLDLCPTGGTVLDAGCGIDKHSCNGIVMLLSCLFFLAACVAPPSISAALSASKLPPGDRLVTAPIDSRGCGKPAPIAPGTSQIEFIDSGGLLRSYLLYLPPDYRETTRYSLVLNFHGHGSNPFIQQRVSGFTTLARQQGFIVAYPWGAIGPDRSTGWDTGLPGRAQVDDVLFASDLLNHLQATLCVDPQRIFATGFSNGGGMTNLLACTLDERIAAFAPVSGSYPPVPGGCHPQRPVPILEFHGTADRIVPYAGNARRREPEIPLWLQQWASRDVCAQGPTMFYRYRSVTGQEWTHCQGGVVVIGYRIPGEGHLWPLVLIHLRPGNLSAPYTAAQVIWSFFQAHPLLSSMRLSRTQALHRAARVPSRPEERARAGL